MTVLDLRCGASDEHDGIAALARPLADPAGLDRHWVPTTMGGRYDAFCYFDDTEALHPLHLEPAQASGEQETYPWALSPAAPRPEDSCRRTPRPTAT